MTSATSDPASTSRDPDFYAYWDSSRQDLYERLLWRLETGSPDSGSNSSNGSALSVPLSSSFSTTLTALQRTNSERTSWPSYKYTVVDGMVGEGTGRLPLQPLVTRVKTLKLRLCPTALQKAKLAQWAGCSRFTYNRAVSVRLAEGSTQRDLYRIRDRLVTLKKRGANVKNTFFDDKPWLLECPKTVRMSAVASAVANVKACFSNLAAGNIKHFSAPFRSKKNESERGWAVGVDQKNVRRDDDQLYVFKDLLGAMKYRSTKQLRKLLPGQHPTHDPKIQMSPFGEYFLVLSVDAPRRQRNDVRCKLSVTPDGTVKLGLRVDHPGFASAAIDPGVRKTQVTYSPENSESFMLGKGHATQLVSLLVAYDKMLSESGKLKDVKAALKMKDAMIRLRKRIFYMKKEYRDQTANFLARRYDILLVPKLGTKDMTLCAGRKLKTKVVRQMLTLGHSMIFSRLQEKCEEYGTAFLQVKEHYTSQTCLRCGRLNKCGETYRCSGCGFTCDRDVVGAAGIYLKAVRRTNPLMTA